MQSTNCVVLDQASTSNADAPPQDTQVTRPPRLNSLALSSFSNKRDSPKAKKSSRHKGFLDGDDPPEEALDEAHVGKIARLYGTAYFAFNTMKTVFQAYGVQLFLNAYKIPLNGFYGFYAGQALLGAWNMVRM
eukprot:1185661-Prorocentrum_minimum.AAC.1